MIRFLLVLPVLLCLTYSAAKARGSHISQDSASTHSPLLYAVSKYHEAIGKQASLYNGTEYVDYKYQTEGHPYFLTNHWGDGTILYDGILYTGVTMLYDVVNEGIVIAVLEQPMGAYNKISVDLERIDNFTFKSHEFVRLGQDSAAAAMPAGFYDLLYTGDSEVIAKRNKSTKREVGVLIYLEEDKYFIRKDGRYHPVKSKASVLKVFKDQKKELSRFLRENGIAFNENPELAITRMAVHYDILIK